MSATARTATVLAAVALLGGCAKLPNVSVSLRQAPAAVRAANWSSTSLEYDFSLSKKKAEAFAKQAADLAEPYKAAKVKFAVKLEPGFFSTKVTVSLSGPAQETLALQEKLTTLKKSL